MSSQLLLSSADLCQSLTVLISLSAYIPQWRKLIKNKSSKDLSLKTWVLWAFSSCLSVYYGLVQFTVHGTGLALVFSSLLGFTFIATTILLVYRYQDSYKFRFELNLLAPKEQAPELV